MINDKCKFASGGACCISHCGDPICLSTPKIVVAGDGHNTLGGAFIVNVSDRTFERDKDGVIRLTVSHKEPTRG